MNIQDFPYIKLDIPDGSLEVRIEAFYSINGKDKTLTHVRQVAKTNALIAGEFNLDPGKSILAGLLHDISAVMRPNDMLLYAKTCDMELDESERRHPFLLHQRLSRVFAETIFSVRDTDVLSAIECHTTLKTGPSKYDMSLFVADKLSWDQEGKPPFYSQVKLALSNSLESACLEYINYMMENALLQYPHKWLLESKAFLETQV